MAYSQGGLIEAADYNNFINGSNQLNTVWSTGTGNAGYGQTSIPTVSQSGLVSASQWASLINTLNSTLTHQSGSGSGISGSITAGQTVNYLSTLSTNINTAYTNRLNAASTGTTTTGTVYSPVVSATNNTTYGPTVFATRTATFASADQARYFFNAGGKLNLVITGVTNNDATARSTDAVSVIATEFGGMSFAGASNTQRTGTGGTLTGSYTSGYYGLTTSAQTIATVTTTSSTYAGDYFTLNVLSNGTQGSHSDKGTVITFQLIYYSAHTSTTSGLYGSSGDTLNVTVNHRIDIVYPETTNLTNSWGTVTIA